MDSAVYVQRRIRITAYQLPTCRGPCRRVPNGFTNALICDKYKINLKKHKNFIIPPILLFLIIIIATTLTSKKKSNSIKEKKLITIDSENINKEYSTEEGEVDKANENDLNNYASGTDP